MKAIVLAGTCLALLIAATTTQAGGYGGHRGHVPHHNKVYRQPPYRPPHYRPVPRHRGPYHHHHYRGRGYYDGYYADNSAAYALGGLAIGALLAQESQPLGTTVERIVVREPVVTEPSRSVFGAVSTPPSRRLLRDLDGNCFDITRAADGREQRVQLPNAECAW